MSDQEQPKGMEDRIKIKKFFFICVDGIPIGEMFNMGHGHRGMSFPSEATGRKLTIEEAQAAKQKMIAYVKDVKLTPKKNRAGSSKRW